MLLEGKTILVTGAARGIGRACSLALGRAGARLVLCDNGSELSGVGTQAELIDELVKELAAEGLSAEGLCVDVSTPEGVEAAFARVSAAGGLDAVVHAAATQRDASLFDLQAEDFRFVLNNNATSAFLVLQAAAKQMRAQRRGGSIVLFSGQAGLRGNLGQLSEAAAKGAVYGLMRTASIELQRFGIRVNAIAPLAKTRQTEGLPLFEKVQVHLAPEHIAPAAVFLCSDLSSELSGQVLSAAGGRLAAFNLSETEGRYKEAEDGLWTPEEIAEHLESICKA